MGEESRRTRKRETNTKQKNPEPWAMMGHDEAAPKIAGVPAFQAKGERPKGVGDDLDGSQRCGWPGCRHATADGAAGAPLYPAPDTANSGRTGAFRRCCPLYMPEAEGLIGCQWRNGESLQSETSLGTPWALRLLMMPAATLGDTRSYFVVSANWHLPVDSRQLACHGWIRMPSSSNTTASCASCASCWSVRPVPHPRQQRWINLFRAVTTSRSSCRGFPGNQSQE